MYRISITRLQPPGTPPAMPTEQPEQPAPETKPAEEIYSQTFAELNVATVISLLNKTKRTRGPAKKKEPKP